MRGEVNRRSLSATPTKSKAEGHPIVFQIGGADIPVCPVVPADRNACPTERSHFYLLGSASFAAEELLSYG
jgi:hypothetical protein